MALFELLLMAAGVQAKDMRGEGNLRGLPHKYIDDLAAHFKGAEAPKTSLANYNKLISPRRKHMMHGSGPDALSRSHKNFAEVGLAGGSFVSNEDDKPSMILDGKPVHQTAQAKTYMPMPSTKDFDLPKIIDNVEKKSVQKPLTKDSNMPLGLFAIGFSVLSFVTMVGARLWRGTKSAIPLANSGGHVADMFTLPTSTENASELKVRESFMGGQEGLRHARVPHRMPALTIRHAISLSTSEELLAEAAALEREANAMEAELALPPAPESKPKPKSQLKPKPKPKPEDLLAAAEALRREANAIETVRRMELMLDTDGERDATVHRDGERDAPERHATPSGVDASVDIDDPVDIDTFPDDPVDIDDYFISSFMAEAKKAAMRSPVPSNMEGACIVNPQNEIVATGYNDFPGGHRSDLPESRMYVLRAEAMALLGAGDVRGCRMYVTLFPCNECAKLIIQSGIREVIYMDDKDHDTNESGASRRLLDSARVRYRQYKDQTENLYLVEDED